MPSRCVECFGCDVANNLCCAAISTAAAAATAAAAPCFIVLSHVASNCYMEQWPKHMSKAEQHVVSFDWPCC